MLKTRLDHKPAPVHLLAKDFQGGCIPGQLEWLAHQLIFKRSVFPELVGTSDTVHGISVPTSKLSTEIRGSCTSIM